MTLAVKVALNPNTTNQPSLYDETWRTGGRWFDPRLSQFVSEH